ncbi:MAG: type II secretion system protein [Candidatus Omnitrophica bacterium]|nr:type II secretion system protein [Candidatus Omnitrophota bacterium]
MIRTHKTKGFTLIELMLVAVMLGALGLAIVATFAGGLKIFNRMQSYTVTRADVLLVIEKMERDLRNTFSFKGIDFIGGPKRMTFPSVLRTVSAKGQVKESPGSVSYYRDDSSHERALSREEKAYAQAVKKGSSEHGDIAVLAPIEDVDFQYFSYDPEAKTYSWGNEWDKSEDGEDSKEEGKVPKGVVALADRPENLPLGVKIKVRYEDGGKIFTLSRVVFIETAVSLNAAKKKALAEKNNPQEAPSE